MSQHERPAPAPLKGGYDVDENAIRFSNYFHVLRELVHLSCGWLPLVPRFEDKLRLGEHLHDDARAVTKVKRRLYELRHPSDYPGGPGAELTTLLDAMNATSTPQAYLDVAYGTVKPALARAIRTHLDALDPVIDEPSLPARTATSWRSRTPGTARRRASSTSARWRSGCAVSAR